MKHCRVSFEDSEGIQHAVQIDATSLYEAVCLAIARFRACEHVPYDPGGLHVFVVEPREPSTEHRITRNQFDKWLGRNGGSPRDTALRNQLIALLGEPEQLGSR